MGKATKNRRARLIAHSDQTRATLLPYLGDMDRIIREESESPISGRDALLCRASLAHLVEIIVLDREGTALLEIENE